MLLIDDELAGRRENLHRLPLVKRHWERNALIEDVEMGSVLGFNGCNRRPSGLEIRIFAKRNCTVVRRDTISS